MSAVLEEDPRLPVPRNTRDEIVQNLWRHNPATAPHAEQLDWSSYFAYYTAECNLAIQFDHGRHTSIRTHRDIISIAGKVQAQQTKVEIKQWLRSQLHQPRTPQAIEEMLNGSLTLVARLLTMTDIGPRPYTSRSQSSWSWADDNMSLIDFLATKFVKQSLQGQIDYEFEEEFTAYNVHRLAGVEIVWTDNLAQHLQLTRNGKKVYIFPHASFLKWQEKYDHPNNPELLLFANLYSHIFPPGLIQETLQTLALLFPSHDTKTRKWITTQAASENNEAPTIDSQLVECGRLRECYADEFAYWGNRLVALHEAFSEPRQRSIFQQWRDKRISLNGTPSGLQWSS
jgi:hypothetical protein